MNSIVIMRGEMVPIDHVEPYIFFLIITLDKYFFFFQSNKFRKSFWKQVVPRLVIINNENEVQNVIFVVHTGTWAQRSVLCNNER